MDRSSWKGRRRVGDSGWSYLTPVLQPACAAYRGFKHNFAGKFYCNYSGTEIVTCSLVLFLRYVSFLNSHHVAEQPVTSNHALTKASSPLCPHASLSLSLCLSLSPFSIPAQQIAGFSFEASTTNRGRSSPKISIVCDPCGSTYACLSPQMIGYQTDIVLSYLVWSDSIW